MAIYVPASRRRRSTMAVAGAALGLGLLLGMAGGRATAPTVDDRIASVRTEALEIAAGLRVVSLHQEAGAESLGNGGDAGTELTMKRTHTRLVHAFGRAPWLSTSTRDALLQEVDSLAAADDPTSAAFAARIDALADRVIRTFGRGSASG